MDALGSHAEGGECRVVQKAAADCLEGMSSFTKQDYAGMKAMEVLKVFSSLARLAALTGKLPSQPAMVFPVSRTAGLFSTYPAFRCTPEEWQPKE